MKRVLIIDNYDSFTYTIALYFRELERFGECERDLLYQLCARG